MAIKVYVSQRNTLKYGDGIKMARYLLLRFENDEDLDIAILEKEIRHLPEVIAVYKAPTVFCECAKDSSVPMRKQAWGRGLKWGWWVCNMCNKPSKSSVSPTFFADTDFGFNLIGPDRINYPGTPPLPDYLKDVPS